MNMNKSLLVAGAAILSAVAFGQTTVYSTGFESPMNTGSVRNQNGWDTEIGQSPFFSDNFVVTNSASSKFGSRALVYNYQGAPTNHTGTHVAFRDVALSDPVGTTYVLTSWVRINSASNNSAEFGIESYGARTGDFFLYLDQSLKIRANGTAVWSRPEPLGAIRTTQAGSAQVWPLNTWHRLELRVTTGNGTGITKASINGQDLWGETPLGTTVNRGTCQIDKLGGIDLLAFRLNNAANNAGLFDGVSIRSFSASQMTIAGRVELGDIAANGSGVVSFAGQPITVQLLDGGSTTNVPATLDADGYWEVSANPGDYDVLVKGQHHLGKAAGSVTASAYARAGFVSLINGDVDGDNQVSILDYIALSGFYEKSETDSDWNVVDPGVNLPPSAADLDEDGSVSILDYLILSGNYELAGEGSF